MNSTPDVLDVRLGELLGQWELAIRAEDSPDLDQFLETLVPAEPELATRFRELILADEQFRPFDSGPEPSDRWPASERLQPGDVVDRYQIVVELGAGGMGIVYQAHDIKLKRDVALKMVLDRGALSGSDLSRFRKEAEAIAQLVHPHIVQIFASGEHEGRPYFVMELMSRGSLSQRLGGQPQSATDSARLVMRLALALKEAHQKQILHRDLKPSNVLLGHPSTDTASLNTAWGWPKIGDFGLAKRLDQPTTGSGSSLGVGTPAYMAPEQIRAGTIGPATDVYGLGAILYEMLSGRPPFNGHTPYDVMEQVVGQPPALLPTNHHGHSPSLDRICLKCLEKDPAARFPSAAAVAEGLREFLAEGAGGTLADQPSEKLVLKFDVLGMMRIFGRSLYNEFGAIVRELVQNSHDAIVEEFVAFGHPGRALDENRIDVRWDKGNDTLVIADTGTGMDRQGIEWSLNNFGESLRKQQLREELSALVDDRLNIIGEYGVGFLSAMAMSEKVEVWSQRAGAKPVRWIYRRGDRFAQVSEQPPEEFVKKNQQHLKAPGRESGTLVICEISQSVQDEYHIDSETIEASLRRYTRILPVPVYFNTEKISCCHLAWTDPAMATEEDWRQMIEDVTGESPLLVIPVISPPHELDIQGVLWVPRRSQFALGFSYIDLYVKRMFITRDDRVIRPSWAVFLLGMINSNSMNRIVSGNTVIEDKDATNAHAFIKGIILDKFKDLRALPEVEYWKIIGPHDDLIKAAAVDSKELLECVWDKVRLRVRNRG